MAIWKQGLELVSSYIKHLYLSYITTTYNLVSIEAIKIRVWWGEGVDKLNQKSITFSMDGR